MAGPPVPSQRNASRLPVCFVLATIVVAEFFGTSLWLSANAVVDSLNRVWGLTPLDLGHLTSAVQLGFIVGTLAIGLSGLADRYSASRIFAVCALLGAVANAAFATADGLTGALALRFATGLALAGIYPIGMKLVVSWAPQKAGAVLGWLVGMLVFGSGLPHFIRGLNVSPNWQGVIYAASVLAAIAGMMVWWLGDGPHHGTARKLSWGGVLQAYRTPTFRSASLGYFGHMWELYAFYAIVPLMIANAMQNADLHAVYLVAAAVFAAGGIGCVAGGSVSHRVGSARVAIVALVGSATCCLIYPLAQGLSAFFLMCILVTWGFFVVADSPQFSAIASKSCPPERVGSALAFMNSVGFAITIVSIELVTARWEPMAERIAWLLLPGPVLSLLAMRTLWKTPTRPLVR